MGFLDKIFKPTNNTEKASYVDNKMSPEYYLLEQEGRSLDAWCIYDSRKKGLPYDCYFEWELEMVEKTMNASNSVQGITDIYIAVNTYLDKVEEYENRELKDCYITRARVMIAHMITMASQGSIYAKAFLAGNSDKKNNPAFMELICENITEYTLEEYRREVENAVSVNNRDAVLAYATLYGDSDQNARKEMLIRAGSMGLSEAYSELFFSVHRHWNSEEGFKYAVAAAECNDGPEAYFFQDKLGDAYFYCDGWGIENQDKSKALYYYNKAAGNGYKSSIYTLERLKANGEI